MKSVRVCRNAAAVSRYHWRLASTTTINAQQPKPAAVSEDGPEEQMETRGEKKGQVDTSKSEYPRTLKKTPFARDLFIGKFDTPVLTFPEVLDQERHETLHEMLEPIERFFTDRIDSRKIDADSKIPQDVLTGLKELGLFGQQIPQQYGGLGLNATEYARIAEITSLDGGVSVTLAAHQAIGLKGLLLYGNEEQKAKFLPKLASGEAIAAFCLTEATAGSDAASVQAQARLSDDGKTWYLSGTKLYISNGGIADFFTVFARTDNFGVTNTKKALTAFIVERKYGGVTSGKPEDKLGIRGSSTTELHFDNTPIPAENVLGEVGDGFKIAVNILNSGRFSMGAAGSGVLKKLIGITTEYAVNRKQFGKPISEFQLIEEKLSRMTVNTYVMESMAYMTAGMLDSEEYEDCAVEAAIVKVFSAQETFNGVNECLQIMGGLGYMKDNPHERYLRDARIMLIFEGTNEILKMFIVLMGFQHAGRHLAGLIKELRNPFKFPKTMMRKAVERWRSGQDNPKMTLGLEGFIHPTLKDESNDLEYGVLRLQYVIEFLFERHGKGITEQQLDLNRVADIVIDIYGMTAVLSRSSRSYCLGLQNAASEVQIAMIFCRQAHARIKKNVTDLVDGKILNCDNMVLELAKDIVSKKGYFLEHPLKRAFW